MSDLVFASNSCVARMLAREAESVLEWCNGRKNKCLHLFTFIFHCNPIVLILLRFYLVILYNVPILCDFVLPFLRFSKFLMS